MTTAKGGAIQLGEEQAPLLMDPPAAAAQPLTLWDHWDQLNYLAKHLIGLIVLPMVFIVPYIAFKMIGLSHIFFFGESITSWLAMFALAAFAYVAISLAVHVGLDILNYFLKNKWGFIIRFLYRSIDTIILFFFFAACIVIYDHFFTVPCDNLPISDPDDPEKPYPFPEQCYLHFIRRLLLCAMLTCLGFLLVKWIVMTISLRYQDKVYRDRIIRNRYQLYVANLLYEGCLEEGAKHGIDVRRMSSNSVASAASDTSETDEEEGDYTVGPPLPGSIQSSGWVRRMISWFKKRAPRRPRRAPRNHPSLARVKLYHLLDFNSFKRTVKVFKSDFTLFETAYDNLTLADAKKRAKFVFEVLRSVTEPGRDYVSCADFQRIFKLKESAHEAFEIFDINFDGAITKAELKHTFAHIYREHHHLTQSVSSSAEALKALDAMLSVLTCIVLGLLYLAIFGINVQSLLTLSLSLILGFNVIIGNFSRDVFDSLIFLFVTHPYDIGDRVRIEGDAKIYTVNQIFVLRTEFHDGKGEEVYMPNPILTRKNIINLRRSHEQWESIDLCLDLSTTEEQLNEFRALLTKFLHDNPQYFYHKFEMELCGQHSNLEVYPVRFRVQCKPSYDTMRRAERHREIMAYMKSTLEKLGISYYPKGPDGPRIVVTSPRRFMTGTAGAPAAAARVSVPQVSKPSKLDDSPLSAQSLSKPPSSQISLSSSEDEDGEGTTTQQPPPPA